MNLLNILLASSLITLILITLLQVDNVTEQMMIFIGLLIIGLVISLLLPKSLNKFNQVNQVNQANNLTSLNSKVYENNNNVVVDNIHLNNVNSMNSVNSINSVNANLNTVELNNLKKMLEADKKIYQRWKVQDENKINNFRELHNPPIPNNKSDDCVADLSCVIQKCNC
jgi:hypothetical protein